MVDRELLWQAIIRQETGHLEKYPEARESALGDMLADGRYRAVGIAQIWKCVVQDVNAMIPDAPNKYTYEDRLSADKSKEIFNRYLDRWGAYYNKTTGRPAGYEQLARIWNGGPSGYRRAVTVKYWDKVRRYLQELGVENV